MKTKIKLLSEDAVIPSRAHDTDSGYDLRMIALDKIVGDVMFFKTGIAIQPPKGYYYRIYPCSRISKYPLELANSVGVIDETYTGEVMIPIRLTHPGMGQDLKNVSFPSGVVKIFDARPSTMSGVAQLILKETPVLCQMILEKRYSADFEVVEELEETERGEGGFGSTSKK